MFSAFLNTLWPVKELVDFIYSNVFGDIVKCPITKDDVEKEIKAKTFCELLNLEILASEFNKNFLNLAPFELIKGSVEKFYIKFPKNYFKEKIEIKIHNIHLVFAEKKFDHNIIKENIINSLNRALTSKNEFANPIQKIINNILNNLEIEIKNIRIEYLLKTEQSLDDSINNQSLNKSLTTNKIYLTLGTILYTKRKENTKDAFFFFNKQVLLFDLNLRFSNQENEKNFLEISDSKLLDQMEKILDKHCLFVTDASNPEIFDNNELSNYRNSNCSLWIKFERDESDKEAIHIDSNLNKLEIILTRDQFEFIYILFERLNEIKTKITKFILSDYTLKDTTRKENVGVNIKSEKDLMILTHKITKIKSTFNLANFNCVLLENITTDNLTKPKIWLLFEQFFKKYYLSFDDRIKDNFNTNIIENIQRHFSYFEDNFFLLNLSKLNLKSTINLLNDSHIAPYQETSILISEINTRYIEPNNRAIKKDFVLLRSLNAVTSEAEKHFDEKYSKILINSIKYGFSSFEIFSLEKIEIRSTKRNLLNSSKITYQSNEVIICISDIKTIINEFVLLKVYNYYLTNFTSQFKKFQSQNENQILEDNTTSLTDQKTEKINNSNSNNPDKFDSLDIEKFHISEPVLKINKKEQAKEYYNQLEIISENNSENKFFISFRLTIIFSHFSQGNQLFKEFYNSYIHLPTDAGINYNTKRIFKISENSTHQENISIRFTQVDIILHKRHGEEFYNIYSDLNKVFFFYLKKNICFPIFTYKNNLYFPIALENLDFSKIEKSKNWALMLTNKLYDDVITFNKACTQEINYAVNSHHIKNQQNSLFEQINAFKAIRNLKNSNDFLNKKILNRKIEIQVSLRKFDLLINYYYLKDLIDHLKISFYYFEYFRIFSFMLSYKLENNQERFKNIETENYSENFSKLSLNLDLNELNLIAFTNLKSNNEGYNHGNFLNENFLSSIVETEKYLNTEENIFNIIDNPFLKIQLVNFRLTAFDLSQTQIFFITSLENFKILIRKNENVYHDIKIKHQIYFQNIYEEENFDYILQRGMTNERNKKNLISMSINYKIIHNSDNEEAVNLIKGIESLNFEDFVRKFLLSEIKQNEFKISSHISIDDVVICPLFYNFEQMIKLIQNFKKEKNKYPKLDITNCERTIQSIKEENKIIKNEISFNEKLFNLNESNLSHRAYSNQEGRLSEFNSLSSKNFDSNSHTSLDKMRTKCDLNINLFITRVIIDLYSHLEKKNKVFTNVEAIHKMRLITEIEGISYDDNIRDSLNDLSIINNNFINSVLPCESDFYPRSISLKISKINSIFLKNLDYSNYAIASLTNKCQNVTKENSYWRKVGFVEILNIDNISINLNKILNNFKSEIIFNLIEFNFCKDSFKYFKKFLDKIKKDFELLKLQITENPETFLNEIDSINENSSVTTNKIKNLKIRNEPNKKESITFKNINPNSELVKSAEINKKANDVYLIDFNLNSKAKESIDYPQSYVGAKAENLFILDKNFEKSSVINSVDKDRKNKFHSDSVYKTEIKEGESFLPSNNENEINEETPKKENNNNQKVTDAKEALKQISERLNLLLVVNNFKFYLLEGNDFLFEDKFSDVTMLTSEDNTTEFNTKNIDIAKTRTYSETVRTQGDCNITISINPKTIKIIDDYMSLGDKIQDSFKKQEEINKQISNFRMKKNQRNYASYLCVNAENLEIRLFFYNNSPVVFTHILDIKSFTIEDSIKDSKFKKMLSKYNFEEDDYSQFLTLKFDFLKNKQNEIEISIFFQIADLNVLIDHLALKFLFNFFKIRLNKNLPTDQDTPNQVQEAKEILNKEVPSVFSQYVSMTNPNIELTNIKDELEKNIRIHTEITKNIEKLFTRRFIIQEFFINISYNYQKITFEDIKEKEMLENLKISSMTDFKLVFVSVDIKDKKTLTEGIKFIFNFWANEIFKKQLISAYIGSISYIRPFKNIVRGFLELFSIPYQYYLEEKPIKEGFVKGMKNFILKFSTESLLVGDNVYSLLSKIFKKKRRKNQSIYKKLIYTINESKRRHDEFYLKE